MVPIKQCLLCVCRCVCADLLTWARRHGFMFPVVLSSRVRQWLSALKYRWRISLAYSAVKTRLVATRCYPRKVPESLSTAVSLRPPCMPVTHCRCFTRLATHNAGCSSAFQAISCMGYTPRYHADPWRAWLLTQSLRKGNKKLIQGDFCCPVLGLLLSWPWPIAPLVTITQHSIKIESVLDNKISLLTEEEDTTMHYV